MPENRMKKVSIITACLFLACGAIAQQPSPAKPDESYVRPYYVQKVSLHQQLSNTKNGIVFIGDSITDGNEWAEQLNCIRCQNRGISGDISAGVLARLDDILAQKPAKIFLMIGINDISRNIPNERIIGNYKEFVRRTRTLSPRTRIYLQSVLPTNDTFRKFVDKNDESIKVLNTAMAEIARGDRAVTYIDLYNRFLDAEGRLDKRYTNDGLHLLGEGYVLWASILKSGGYLK